MEANQLIIAFLLGVVTNIITFLLTKNYTTQKDREIFRREEKEGRASIADAAVGHLRSSYLAVKKLELSALEQQRKLTDEKFQLIIWGISQSLEQIRLGLQGHMNVWKNELPPESDTLRDLTQFITEDIVFRVSVGESGPRPVTSPVQPDDSTFKPSRLPGVLESLRQPPGERLMRQLLSGDFQGLFGHLKDLVRGNGNIDEIIAIGGLLTINGNEEARDHLIELFRKRYDEMAMDSKKASLSAIGQWYVRHDRETEGAPLIEDLSSRMLTDPSINDQDKAFLYNLLQNLWRLADNPSRAVELGEKAIKLDPDEFAYLGGLAQAHDKLGNDTKAQELYERALATNGGKSAAGLLSSAIKFYQKLGSTERSEQLLARLSEIDPVKVEMLRFPEMLHNIAKSNS